MNLVLQKIEFCANFYITDEERGIKYMENEINALTGGFLKEPGDELSARITKSGRGVLKIKTKNENYSQTVYPNGTIVETKSKKNQ